MPHPAPSPAKLLEAWMDWERGEALPGRTMSTLKTGGLRVLLESLVQEAPAASETPVDTEAWTPVV